MTNLALIGNGKWGKRYLEAIKKINDVNIKYVKTHDYKDLLEKDDIDGIIIATPDNTHAEIINTFPDHYLLVEKPFTTSLEEAIKIKNKKIMVGYIYLYNLDLIDQMKDLGQIRKIEFSILNIEKAKDTTPLWYLASHAVSFCVLHLGNRPQISVAENKKDHIKFELDYGIAKCEIEAKWGVAEKLRKIIIEADKKITYDGKEKSKITPLENELRSFVNFIHGTAIPSNLTHAIDVTNILSEIEKKLYAK